MTVTVVDYGMGNLRSVAKAVEKAGSPTVVTSDPEAVVRADKLILPGVGAFGDCRANLESLGLWDAVREAAGKGTPLLGICLGYQLLFSTSTEFGLQEGFGLIPGKVERFPEGEKVPHMGWNQVTLRRPHPIMAGIPDETFFYFVHSYYPWPDERADLVGETFYGVPFAAIAGRDNLVGTQFHPEKSQRWGLKVLENFVQW